MLLYNIIKNVICMIILINIFIINNINKVDINESIIKLNKYSNLSLVKNISNIPKIFFNIIDLKYCYSKKFDVIEVKYFISVLDNNYNNIKPSNILSLYGIRFLCNIYIYETNKNIYSIANIYKNRLFYCIEFIKIEDKVNFGIKVYKINSTTDEIEYFQQFFFTEEMFNIDQNLSLENDKHFDIFFLNEKYNELIKKIKKFKDNSYHLKEGYNLKSSFLQPPFFSLKRDITLLEGKWSFNNIYETYFCFCNGESCISIINFNSQNFQSCKYNYYLTIIDNNRNLYQKTDYLLSDFFDENIESSDVFPIFKEMYLSNFKVHYLTLSPDIYNLFCLNNKKCLSESPIIFGIKKIIGDTLEKLLALFLKLKAVITAEKYYAIDNLFYNIDYITYIFLGHGVTYIKSYLYKDYLNPKNYNKILLPPCKKFINLAIDAGWKNENIIKIGYPRWDDYTISNNIQKKNESSIFLMFTWRKMKKGKKISDEYFINLSKLLNSRRLNAQLNLNNVKLFYCFHHTLKDKKTIQVKENNIKLIIQNDISTLLKNSSLIITDFSSILFDAIVQKKPLILFIPDGLDPNLEDIYTNEYYETIYKIKNGLIYLNEVFLDLRQAINKIIYYIKNNFILEDEKLKFYKTFRLKNNGNKKKFINYLKNL